MDTTEREQNRVVFSGDNNIGFYLKKPNMKHPALNPQKKYSQVRQDEVVFNILNKTNGFFIEIGAFNGVLFSNTLWLERMYNWTGLLIEANPSLCKQIDEVRRHVWRLCACISTQHHVTFIPGHTMGGVKNNIDSNHLNFLRKEKEITVPCFTLYDVLDVIKVFKIDYLSLDVEGAELYILGTIKNQLMEGKIWVGVWTIEYRVYDGHKVYFNKSKENLEKLRLFFKEIPEYVEHSQLSRHSGSPNLIDGSALDVVFVHIDIWCRDHQQIPNKTDCAESRQSKQFS